MDTVFLIEDNPQTCLLLDRLLHDSFEVVIAKTPAEALEKVEQIVPALILMDIDLNARRNGTELLKTFREEQKIDETVPVMALTAYALPGDRERFLDSGFDSYVSKPFTREILMKEIDALLED